MQLKVAGAGVGKGVKVVVKVVVMIVVVVVTSSTVFVMDVLESTVTLKSAPFASVSFA